MDYSKQACADVQGILTKTYVHVTDRDHSAPSGHYAIFSLRQFPACYR